MMKIHWGKTRRKIYRIPFWQNSISSSRVPIFPFFLKGWLFKLIQAWKPVQDPEISTLIIWNNTVRGDQSCQFQGYCDKSVIIKEILKFLLLITVIILNLPTFPFLVYPVYVASTFWSKRMMQVLVTAFTFWQMGIKKSQRAFAVFVFLGFWNISFRGMQFSP